MTIDIKEIVTVVAVFDKGMRPAKFKWNGRVYSVKEVTYEWKSMQGSAQVHHFSVTDCASLYELSYNPSTFVWILEGVE